MTTSVPMTGHSLHGHGFRLDPARHPVENGWQLNNPIFGLTGMSRFKLSI